jgi:hypothetical protein
MSKFSSLILLINSLNKSELKSISTELNVGGNNSDYVFLYRLIEKSNINSQEKIKEEFIKSRKDAGLNTSINYLFDTLLYILSRLRTNQDSFFTLFNLLMNAKVLYEKSIYQECFQILTKIQSEAIRFENFSILLIAQKMELDYLLSLDFPNITESELLNKQFRINDTLKKIRKINEHASLYELLKHRILHKGTVRSTKQKQEFNDLVVSEMSIVSSLGFDNFETQKTHKLFQSNYLINVGDYKSALHSFYELNDTFEQNKHLLSNPPMYYLMTIEGVLESLRTIKNYEGMSYFITQLNNIETVSSHFKIQINCVVFLYSLFPLLDRGEFEKAKALIEDNKENLYDKINLLTAARQAQLTLYTGLVYLGTKDYKRARKSINQVIMSEKNIFALPLHRTIRLVNLMILYELNEFDYIAFEARSIKREIHNNERIYQIEHLILKLFNKSLDPISKKERLNLWTKIEPELIELHNNKFELQLLRVFDFTAWIESKIKNIPLSLILEKKNQILTNK